MSSFVPFTCIKPDHTVHASTFDHVFMSSAISKLVLDIIHQSGGLIPVSSTLPNVTRWES